tara:strand:+ start:5751 stop:6056 length:306 start_codon:yes stop_codon:yes gene_type:complete
MKAVYKLKGIVPSTKADKKLMAVFINMNNEKTKTVHFGNSGMNDFTITGDKEAKIRYLARHRTREDWDNPITAGALSRWVLWNKPTIKASIADYKKRFRFK